MTPPADEFFIVGRVRRAHGIRGELAVEVITDAPDAIFAPGRRVFAGTVDGDPARAAGWRLLDVDAPPGYVGALVVERSALRLRIRHWSASRA